MKDGKFRVFYSCSEEICDRIRAGVEGNGIEGRGLRSSPLKVHSISDIVVSDVPCNFFLILFVNEDQRVMF